MSIPYAFGTTAINVVSQRCIRTNAASLNRYSAISSFKQCDSRELAVATPSMTHDWQADHANDGAERIGRRSRALVNNSPFELDAILPSKTGLSGEKKLISLPQVRSPTPSLCFADAHTLAMQLWLLISSNGFQFDPESNSC